MAPRLAGEKRKSLRERGDALVKSLESIEAVLVDIHRVSPRDVLRNPAGLNDTLMDLVSVVAIADEAPTSQAVEVSEDIMARVAAEIARLVKLEAGEVAALNAALAKAGVDVLGAA